MGILDMLKSVLGGGSDESDARRADADATSEATVKGTEPAAAGGDAGASTGSMTEEPPDGTPDGDDAVAAAAEPAEAAGPTTQVDDEDDPAAGTDDDLGADAPPEGDAIDDLTTVNGIGPAYAKRLQDAGVESVAELADGDVAALAESTGVSEKRVQRWVDAAREH